MAEESKIEKALRLFIESLGGLCLKWTSPQYTGVPDRIIFLGGFIWVVETKAPKGRISDRQDYVHGELDARGTKVHIVHNWDHLKDFKQYVLQSTQLSAASKATHIRQQGSGPIFRNGVRQNIDNTRCD